MATADVATPKKFQTNLHSLDDNSSPRNTEDHGSFSSSPVSSEPSTRHLKFIFTPKRVKSLPRAWERKPSTPFAPRNENQRIWRRIPLEELHANPNLDNSLPRGTKVGKGYVRPLKKLRIENSEEEDKENQAFVGTQWKLEEEKMSPVKRKEKVSVLGETAGVEMLDKTDDATSLDSIGALVNFPMLEQSPYFDTSKRSDAGSAALSPGASFIKTSESDTQDNTEAHVPGSMFRTSKPPPKTVIAADSDEGILPEQDIANENNDKCARSNSLQICLIEGQNLPDTIMAQVSSIAPDTTVSFVLASPLNRPPEVSHDPISVSPGQPKSVMDSPQARAAQVQHVPSSISSSNTAILETDDTAFLYDFLARTRAQKSTKDEPSNLSQADPEEVSTEVYVDEVLPVPTPAQPEDDFLIEMTDDVPSGNADDIELSPRRRSLRSASTRLPLPKTSTAALSSNISLKRLTGKEFILQRGEAHTLALATRTNTNRNKGDAKPPQIRLIQLRAEYHDYEDKTAESDSALDKKKRRKGGKRNVKGVTWEIDEKLVQVHGQDGVVVNIPIDPALVLPTQQDQLSQDHVEVETTTADSKAKKKIKKLGTINGTPAKKGMLESDFADDVEPKTDANEVKVPKVRVSRLPRKG